MAFRCQITKFVRNDKNFKLHEVNCHEEADKPNKVLYCPFFTLPTVHELPLIILYQSGNLKNEPNFSACMKNWRHQTWELKPLLQRRLHDERKWHCERWEILPWTQLPAMGTGDAGLFSPESNDKGNGPLSNRQICPILSASSLQLPLYSN